jgi:hypothetical protein
MPYLLRYSSLHHLPPPSVITMTTLYLVTAGNVIYEDVTEDVSNPVEIFDNFQAAEEFGALFDFHSIVEKTLNPVVPFPKIG